MTFQETHKLKKGTDGLHRLLKSKWATKTVSGDRMKGGVKKGRKGMKELEQKKKGKRKEKKKIRKKKNAKRQKAGKLRGQRENENVKRNESWGRVFHIKKKAQGNIEGGRDREDKKKERVEGE